MTQPFQILAFDSDLFGFKVAKILPSHLNLMTLQNILQQLQQQKVKLVYWMADSNDQVSTDAAQTMHGVLGSKQVTFVINLEVIAKSLQEAIALPQEIIIQEYTATKPSKELEALASQAGKYSHFQNDPQFPKELFIKLYQHWIANSVNKTIADKVIVAKAGDKLAGMITVGHKNKRGDIGLLAVNAEFRGKNIGYALVKTAQKEFWQAGFKTSQVVTQEANKPACRLYEKCGHHIEKIENYYHFWLS
jgi:dTDP-4-amino-4,6-dideoxy-D-galactose acyltransferase